MTHTTTWRGREYIHCIVANSSQSAQSTIESNETSLPGLTSVRLISMGLCHGSVSSATAQSLRVLLISPECLFTDLLKSVPLLRAVYSIQRNNKDNQYTILFHFGWHASCIWRAQADLATASPALRCSPCWLTWE